MKRLFPFIASILLALSVAPKSNAQEAPDALFVIYYTLIQNADALSERQQDRPALNNYLKARDGLENLKKAYPGWNPKIISFRLDYVNDKIGPLLAKYPPSKSEENKAFPPATIVKGNKAIASQIGALNNEIIRLQARNKQLQADIEAAKTITANPAELTQAKAQIERLEKERAGLDAQLEANQQKLATMVDQAVVDEVQRELAAANQRAAGLVDPGVHRSAQEKLEANEKRLAEQSGAVARLTQENVALKGRVKELGDSPRNARARAENRALKNQVSEMSRKVAAISKIEAQNETLTKRIGSLEEENEGLKANLRDEKKRLADMSKAADASGQAKQLASLGEENQKLDARLQALVKNEIPALESENAALKKQVRDLDRASSGAQRTQRENADLREENATLKKTAGELEASLKAERKTVAKLSSQSDDPLRRDLAEANARLDGQAIELARVGEQGQKLREENSALRDTLKRDQRSMAKMVDASVADEVRRELEQTKRDHARQLERGGADAALTEELAGTRREIKRKDAAIAALRKENEKLEGALTDPKAGGNDKELKALEKQLADAEKARKKNEESAANLAEENASLKQSQNDLEKRLEEAELAGDAKAAAKRVAKLEKELAGVQTDRDELAEKQKALQDERDAQARQLRDAERNNPLEAELKTLKSAQRATEAKFASLERGNARLAKRNEELESELAAAKPARRRADAKLASKVESLEAERDEMARELKAATKQLDDRKALRASAKVGELADELAQVRARLEVLDARKVPYTAEELALFDKKPAGTTNLTPGVGTTRKATRKLPAAAGVLVAEAQRAYNARRYSDAEKKYLEVLKMSDSDVSTLVHLAGVQIEQNRLGEAEANLKKALAEDANDPFALFQMGYLCYRQQKLDDALNHLSRASELEPDNADAHNYLGIVLSEQGQRAAAEAHLRKAIQIEPGNAGAHHNLAVIYASQKPPLPELARWHYQKAREAGHPENADLEARINQK